MKKVLKKPVIVIGGGGHGRVVIDALLASKAKVLGFADKTAQKASVAGRSIPYLGTDEDVLKKYPPSKVFLANGVGSTGDVGARRRIYEKFKAKNYVFAVVRHPSAVISADVALEEGAQVMAGAVIQTGSRIGRNSIVNTRASVDHDCRVADHVHIAPGAVLSGGVTVEEASHVGTAASVVQMVKIGRRSLIQAGAWVHGDVLEDFVFQPGGGGYKKGRGDRE